MDENNIRALASGSKRLEASKEKATLIGNANKRILWEAIKWAKDNGIKEFDFGGYYTGTEVNSNLGSINKFKDSFGGVATKKYIYQKNYSMLYDITSKMYVLMHKG
jgi:lipid II:glycine glycyltransferase (peptidoglycan interpeptide bridge formation enzyme)